VSELYASLFEGNALYDPAWTAEERCEISADWLWRLANEVPPGFKDASAGDLIIWRTILRLGAERKRSVTFVSFDRKRDWWHRHKGGPLHPRFELIDEFRRASGGESFNIVSLNEMLEMIGTEPRLVSAVAEEEGSRFWNAEDEEASGWRHCGGELSFSIKKYLADQVGGWYENESVHEHPSGLHVLEWSGKRIAYFERNISPRDAVDGAWVRSVHDCVAAYKRENPDDEVHVIFAHPSAGVLTPFKELHGWYLQTRINYLQSATIAFISEQGPI
jgi:hypothetical protein